MDINRIETLLADEMAKMKVGGLSFAIIKDDTLLHQNGIGARNLDKNLPADENTIYNVASLSKSFVCTAIMILVDEGKLAIDDPANKYIPLTLGAETKPITIKHLMNHTSGIPDLSEDTFTYRYDKAGMKKRGSAKLIPLSSKDDFYRLINNAAEYCHDLDEYFHYNNYGYAMLGHIIEKVSGEKDFTQFIKKRIFDPLGMAHSSFNPDDFKDDDNLCTGYHQVGDKITKMVDIGRWHERWEFLAAGGVFSCIKDLIPYMMMHLNLGKFNGNQIISEQSALLMQQDSLIAGTMAKKVLSNYTYNQSAGYGFGFFIDSDFFGNKSVDHGGNMFGGTADFRFIPEQKMGIISLANNLSGPRSVLTAILAKAMGVEEDNIPYLTEREHFKSLNGIYENYRETSRVKITGEVGSISIQDVEIDEFSGPPMQFNPLEEISKPMEFYLRGAAGGKFIIFFEYIDNDLWVNIERSRFKRIGKV
ncbi:MAG: serine hydrolase [Candidatus Heimdallarchaeota archaeon]|nr:serine hydrolase [Candidatus Heimdallarchaeota archaeon]